MPFLSVLDFYDRRIVLTLFLFGRPHTAQLTSSRHTLQRPHYSSPSKRGISIIPQDDADIKVVSDLDVLSNSNGRTSFELLLTLCSLDSLLAC